MRHHVVGPIHPQLEATGEVCCAHVPVMMSYLIITCCICQETRQVLRFGAVEARVVVVVVAAVAVAWECQAMTTCTSPLGLITPCKLILLIWKCAV